MVGMLSRVEIKTTVITCKLLVYLKQYLLGVVILGMRFSGCTFGLHIFTDVDWAGDVLTRRSTTGYVIFASEDFWCGSQSNSVDIKHAE